PAGVVASPSAAKNNGQSAPRGPIGREGMRGLLVCGLLSVAACSASSTTSLSMPPSTPPPAGPTADAGPPRSAGPPPTTPEIPSDAASPLDVASPLEVAPATPDAALAAPDAAPAGEAPTTQPDTYVCNFVIGIKETGEWFNAGFEKVVDNTRWQVVPIHDGH